MLEPLRSLNNERRRTARIQRLTARKRLLKEHGEQAGREGGGGSESDDLHEIDAGKSGGGDTRRSADPCAAVLQDMIRAGLNEVTRALEAAEVRLVLVCR